MMDNVVDDFKQSYNQVCKLPYLIIDIRGNGGGNSNNARLIEEYLLKEPQEHCVGGNITPQPNVYSGKLFLLTSNHTFSAAESFTIDLKESGYVTLVGEKTAGDTGCAPKNFTSKYGIWFRIPTRDPHFSPKGFPMEGVSVEPNHEVKQTVTDFFDDKDTAIEYVLNKLIYN
jgi:carboxyl-terminal processing protease